ncbi:PaaI family thioesterase [Desulforegula conservatrix]|uniref:PaaI family thioesterase n=1 Tax=Desulforegula conservatrix TaxID=153026 RepID=UPI000423234F|nr:PaaI family thioesterase [Desulforegula conservatrix]
MSDHKKKPSKEISDKIINLMNSYKGESLSKFPIKGVTRWLDARLISFVRGEIILEYKVRSEMTNPAGYLHGGIQVTMLDDAVGTVCAGLGYEKATLSIDVHTDFLGVAKTGDVLTARAFIIREGSNIINASAELRDSKNDLVAKMNTNIMISNMHADYMSFINSL